MKKHIGCCGHDCSRCFTYIATVTNDDDLRIQSEIFYKDEFGLDVPLEDIHCQGCCSEDVFYLCRECPWVRCCIGHNIDVCSNCGQYPCQALSQYQEKYVNKVNQAQETDKLYEVAYCGLACFLCSERDCIGCHNGGCEKHGWCKNYNCCKEKRIEGCWECDEFPCNEGMLKKMRICAFARFAKEYGKAELIRCLLKNKNRGIEYHYEGQLTGDYDKCQIEEEIIEMIINGKNEDQREI